MSAEGRAPLLVEAYSFGSIRVRGRTYDGDVVLAGDTISRWWREEGHLVSPADIAPILATGAQVLVIGTGHSGGMEVSAEAAALCGEKGVELIVRPTAQATRRYNELLLEAKRRVAGAFHVTC
jgi:hypothetical protein